MLVAYSNPQWGPYRESWRLTREAGGSAFILLMFDPGSVSEIQGTVLRSLLGGFDYAYNSSCGVIYHLATCWNVRARQVLGA